MDPEVFVLINTLDGYEKRTSYTSGPSDMFQPK
jgi:hypothetical protein